MIEYRGIGNQNRNECWQNTQSPGKTLKAFQQTRKNVLKSF